MCTCKAHTHARAHAGDVEHPPIHTQTPTNVEPKSQTQQEEAQSPLECHGHIRHVSKANTHTHTHTHAIGRPAVCVHDPHNTKWPQVTPAHCPNTFCCQWPLANLDINCSHRVRDWADSNDGRGHSKISRKRGGRADQPQTHALQKILHGLPYKTISQGLPVRQWATTVGGIATSGGGGGAGQYSSQVRTPPKKRGLN